MIVLPDDLPEIRGGPDAERGDLFVQRRNCQRVRASSTISSMERA